MEDERLLNLAVDAGEIILESGGEINRVEDTMGRIMNMAGDYAKPEAAVFPTGIFASLNGKNGQITKIKRVRDRNTDLLKLDSVNTLSRKFVAGECTIEYAENEILRIRNLPKVKSYVTILCISMSCFFLSFMYDITIYNNFISFLTALIFSSIMNFMYSKNIPDFIVRFVSGVVISTFAIIFYKFNLCSNYDSVIISCIMPLVPGVTITNALRDVLNGDFVAGTSRIMEAVIVAVATASGVGIVLKIGL